MTNRPAHRFVEAHQPRQDREARGIGGRPAVRTPAVGREIVYRARAGLPSLPGPSGCVQLEEQPAIAIDDQHMPIAIGSTAGALPLGARLRLKASKDLSRFPGYIQNIFRGMQTHGLIVADNGSDMYVSGAMDPRWNTDELNPAFRALTAADFDVIRLGWR